MQEASWWMDILRPFFYSLDKMVYGLINTLYNLFIFVSDLTLFNDSDFAKFTNKVYLILGIIMLFKIAFSLITLFANPDDLMDSGKGVTGIVKRIIISLIVITFVPTIFQTAYRIQTIVLHDNIVGNFFLGDITKGTSENGEEINADTIQRDAGKMVSFSVLSAFYYPEKFMLKYEPEDPQKLVIKEENGKKYVDFAIEPGEWSSEACAVEINDGQIEKTCNGYLYYEVTHNSYDVDDYGQFVRKDADVNGEDYYIMHYMYIISTVAGIAVAWIFFGFCFDVAIRAVKLSVLQLIAPIPVFSYIDPKKGESVFKNWYTTCISTYVSLFMRLILIFFVIYICYIIGNADHGILQINAEGKAVAMQSNSLSLFAKALMMFGVLYFAKSAPKLFSEMLGIKMDESFGTKVAKMGIAGTALAAGVGGAKYLGSKYRRGLEKGNNRLKLKGIQDKLDSGNISDEEREELIKEKSKLQYQNKWSQGLKQNFNATRYGMTAGFMGGYKSGKVSMAGLKQGTLKANKTEKIRNDGVSFYKQAKETVSQYAGVAGKYGDFGQFKNEIRDKENARRRLHGLEEQMRRQYANQSLNFSNEYQLSTDSFNAMDKAMESGDIKAVNEARLAAWKEYEKQIDDAIKADTVQLAKIEKDFSDKYREIYRTSKQVNSFDKQGQDMEKTISDLKKKQESVNVSGK